jgi:hypothetical protein
MPKRKKTEGRNSVDLATDFYSTPNANLVSFERKDKPTDYEYEADPRNKPTDYESEVAEMSAQQALRKSIKRGENAPLAKHEFKETGGSLSAGRCKPAPEGGGAVDCGYGSTYGRTAAEITNKDRPLSTINKDLEADLKTATSSARSAFKHWEAKGIIRKGQKFESLPSKERALLTDMAYQLGSSGLKKYKKLAISLASGKSPNKENVKKELDVTWKPPGEARKKDTRRNKIRRKAYTV